MKNTKMGDIVMALLVISAVMIFSWVWKALYSVYWKPMQLQKYLKKQGFKGPRYKFLHGDLKEMASATLEAQSKPMELSHDIVPRVLPFIHRTVETHGKLSFTWRGPTPTVNIIDPGHIRDIMCDKFGRVSRPKLHPLGKLLATGLAASEGEKWVKHRRIINPAFHLEKLKTMLPAFFRSCDEMISKWESLVSEKSCELDVWPEFQKLSADVISRTAFGSSYEEGQRVFQLQNELTLLVIKIAQSVYIPGFRFVPTKRNNRVKEIAREVRTLLGDMIKMREKAMKTGKAPTNDLLGLLMESNLKETEDKGKSNNAGMSIDDIIEECKLFYIAGQETTSTLLVWTMILLSMHPEWQVKAREEVIQVFGKRKPNFEGLNDLKIVTMIFYEVLRLYPPVAMLDRATYKNMQLGEICLPAGVDVILPVLLVHHSRELWGEDVNKFNPERFSGGISKATKNQVSFFPFGWGPRICVGQVFALIEAKTALALILQRFTFELSSTYIHAPYSVITIKPQHGAQLILHKI